MLQRNSKTVAIYLERAFAAHERAHQTTDPEMKKFHEDMCSKWMNLAASTAFVERVDLFLRDSRLAWRPIATAPFDRDLEVAVIERDGPHPLVFPCRRSVGVWFDAETRELIDMEPTHWRPWTMSRSKDADE